MLVQREANIFFEQVFFRVCVCVFDATRFILNEWPAKKFKKKKWVLVYK